MFFLEIGFLFLCVMWVVCGFVRFVCFCVFQIFLRFSFKTVLKGFLFCLPKKDGVFFGTNRTSNFTISLTEINGLCNLERYVGT